MSLNVFSLTSRINKIDSTHKRVAYKRFVIARFIMYNNDVKYKKMKYKLAKPPKQLQQLDEKQFREIVASNIIYYRKKFSLTQLQLAEHLNYSDKAISKWERGDALPDIYTLQKLATFFGVTLNDFLTIGRKPRAPLTIKARILISVLSNLLVWLVATAAFVIVNMIKPDLVSVTWRFFIYAIPLSSIILLVFSLIWGNNKLSFLFFSTLAVGVAISIYLSIFHLSPQSWLIFIALIPVELLGLFWFFLRKIRKTPKE